MPSSVHGHAKRAVFAVVLSLAGAAQAAGPTGLLNDTGLTQCYNGTAMAACDEAATGDASARPRQDGRFGRDVGSPVKVGAGSAGFDFTKMCMDGTLNCASAADTTASPASGGAWVCTKDNVTNLIWSLHSGQGEWTTYARTTLPAAHNAQSRCGFADGWRLPTRRELLSIVNYDGSSPSVDATFFPATLANDYWSNDPSQLYPADRWYVHFGDGHSLADSTTNLFHVRLVRSGQ